MLIFAGMRDLVVPLVNAEFLAARIPRSQLALIDSGHFVWEEASDKFAAMIAAWVTVGHRAVAERAGRSSCTHAIRGRRRSLGWCYSYG